MTLMISFAFSLFHRIEMLNNSCVFSNVSKWFSYDLQTVNNVNPFAQSDILQIYLENVHAVIYAKYLTALFCFYQSGFSVTLLEQWLSTFFVLVHAFNFSQKPVHLAMH